MSFVLMCVCVCVCAKTTVSYNANERNRVQLLAKVFPRCLKNHCTQLMQIFFGKLSHILCC